MRGISALCLAMVLAGCAAVPTQPRSNFSGEPVRLVASDGREILLKVEIADDDQERATGLMHRTELPDGRGMLFVFEREQPMSFWMKNTLIPLDIIFFDASGTLVSTATMEPCTADPCRTYPSEGPAQFALELGAGVLAREGIGADWKLETIPLP